MQPTHYIVTLLIATFCGAIATEAAHRAVEHFQTRGGFKPSTPPPAIVLRGGPLPQSYSLSRYIVRVHDQGTSSSCVAQTGSTMDEIVAKEEHRPVRLSAGFLYNQINGGRDGGATYPDLFRVLTTEGDAPLSVFSLDGQGDIFTQPGAYAIGLAGQYKFSSYRSIAPYDTYSIRYEIAHGRPLALAIPVLADFLNYFSGYSSPPVIYGQSGAFQFDHSMTVVGYTPDGVEILNSWGPHFGFNGRVILSWGFLTANNAEIVASNPVPYHAPVFHAKPFPAKLWNQRRAEKHQPLIAYKDKHGHLIYAAQLWLKHNPAKTGGILGNGTFFPQPHGRGFMRTSFQGANAYFWIHHPWVKWQKRKWAR